ncbi:MAG: cyclic-di-AMP receptor, partial [Clostridiales bacterium]|nr:cyclic-di-AMP receptor [Clostridiales bacterium]
TRLNTTGGFLKSGNITMMTGVDDDRLNELIDIIGKYSSKRTQIVQPSPVYGNDIFVSSPVEITVGGATVFVLDVEQFHKL